MRLISSKVLGRMGSIGIFNQLRGIDVLHRAENDKTDRLHYPQSGGADHYSYVCRCSSCHLHSRLKCICPTFTVGRRLTRWLPVATGQITGFGQPVTAAFYAALYLLGKKREGYK